MIFERLIQEHCSSSEAFSRRILHLLDVIFLTNKTPKCILLAIYLPTRYPQRDIKRYLNCHLPRARRAKTILAPSKSGLRPSLQAVPHLSVHQVLIPLSKSKETSSRYMLVFVLALMEEQSSPYLFSETGQIKRLLRRLLRPTMRLESPGSLDIARYGK